MKVVLDTNIYISAFLRGGKPDAILDWIAEGFDTLFITDDILREVEDVIKRPYFELTADEVKQKIMAIETLGKKVSVSPEHKATGASRDPKDDKILECALAAGADYIITGDKDLLVLKKYRGIKIITVNEYLDIITTK